MGTRTSTAKEIKKNRADYVLALKRNHKNSYEDVKEYFTDKEFLEGIK